MPRVHRRLARFRPIGFALVAAIVIARPAPADEKPPVVTVSAPTRPVVPRDIPDETELADVVIDPDLRRLVHELASDSYEEREAAMTALFRRRTEIPQLCAILSEESLKPEQRYRILMVIQQQLVTAPRGAVGIRMEWRRPEGDAAGEIEIVDLLPGLPGEQVLQIGDRVTHVSGRQLQAANDLVILVQTKRPGDKVVLRVRRMERDDAGEVVVDDEGKVIRRTLDLELELGSADQLIDPNTGQPQRGGLVERERLDQANELVQRFAPRPDFVDLRGDGSETLVADAWPTSSRGLRSHPDISAIREHVRRLEGGRVPLTAARRAGLMQQIELLAELAERPQLLPADIAALQDLQQRIVDLIAE